jgi:cysteine desulfurase/selenocysteine lyase
LKAPLIAPDEFVGLDAISHLCAGGEAPFLKSHFAALERFATDKSGGMAGRDRMFETYQATKEHLAWLVNRPPSDIALLTSSSDGVNLIARSLDWRSGDNVVVADVEFPSLLYPWTLLADRGVEVRVVRSRERLLDLDLLREAVDSRTRVVAVSQVSYLTGQRLSLPAIANIAWQNGARLLVDATHALGAVAVDANYCDFLVCSCYKWLLAAHGVGIFVLNRSRISDLPPSSLGWHSVARSGGLSGPLEFTLRADADRFESANPSFPSLYLLRNALERLAEIPARSAERHVLELSKAIRDGLVARGVAVTTPEAEESRAGNVCFEVENAAALVSELANADILVWGSEGRVRVSTHVYNSSADVDRFFSAFDLITSRALPVSSDVAT